MIKAEAIWKRSGSFERAEFLWNMYRSYSIRNRATLTGRYLDIGAGGLVNTIVFSQRTRSKSGVGIDISSHLTKSHDIVLVRADARALPFRDGSFELITIISLIEHIREHFVCLSEALRVLSKDGELFMQFPNRYFPIELHSGLLMHFYLPKCLRDSLANAAGLGWMKEVDVPALGNMARMLRQLEPARGVATVGFAYPESLLPDLRLMRMLHRILKRIGIFRILPMGYIVLVHASSPSVCPGWIIYKSNIEHDAGLTHKCI